jgi:hypothetical protein
MNKLITSFSRLALLAAIGFGFASCTTEDTVGPGNNGAGPLNVAANSRSATSIGVAWQRQTSDVTADTVVAMANGVEAQRVVVAAPDTTAVVNGLALNTLYVITVHSAAGVSSSVTWAPAIRTQTVRLYETADNAGGHFSGLVLNGNDIGQGPSAAAVSTADAAPNHLSADVVFASDQSNTNSFLTIVSPAVTSISGIEAGKYSKFSSPYQDPVAGRATGMDQIYYTGDLRTTIATSGTSIVNAIELTTTTNENPLVFNVLTADNHFARVEVMPQPSNGGRLYAGSAGQNYIDVMVSYQPLTNTPYASRATPIQKNVAPIRWRTK